MGRLDERVAIVTGAGRGIGRQHALLFAEEGARVVVNDLGQRTGASASDVAEEIVAAGGVAVADSNSATWDGAPTIVEHAMDAFGRIDIVVNNATAGGNDNLWTFPEEEWDRTQDVNLKGYFALIRAAVPHLAESGSGAIVNTSSSSGFGHPSHVAYASAKEGVVGLTRTVAKEVGRFGIRCNAIRPLALGPGVSEYHDHTARWRALMDVTMGKSSEVLDPAEYGPDKISPFVVWLCTDAASGVNGRTFFVSGGRIMLMTEPKAQAVIDHDGGWTLDDLDRVAPTELVDRLTNRYRLDEHPHLQEFPSP
ncbi:MAG: SDR family oxidoreductase [Acidimicrobiales bacterium]|nr:SDR family oxidoreductase [Acidimicrobiales bacterium]